MQVSRFATLIKSDPAKLSGTDPVDKADLVGVPFIVLSATFAESKLYNGTYVTCNVLLQDDSEVEFSDGSTGVYAQLALYCGENGLSTEKPVELNLLVPRGLRLSEWTPTRGEAKGKLVRTYYLTK